MIVVGTITSDIKVVDEGRVEYDVMVVRDPEIDVVIVEAGRVLVVTSISVEVEVNEKSDTMYEVEVIVSRSTLVVE